MIEYDPFSDAVMRDPYPHYAELRREAPVFYHDKYDTWFLSRFEDIRASTSSDLFTAERGVTPEMVLLKQPPPPDPVFSMLDLPRQRDYRRMLAPRYKKNATLASEPSIRALTKELLEPLSAKGHFDVYSDLADPLATFVIADLIGLPKEEALWLRSLIADFFERKPGQIGTSEENAQAQIALMTRIAGIIEEKRSQPDPEAQDHISVMLRTPAEGKPLELGAILSAVFTMLVTGVEVIPLSVANTIYSLWQSPDQRQSLVADPSLIEYAYAESLRYDQPTNLLGRFVKEPVQIRDQKLLPGQGVMFLWASGNRDEEEFERADVFDISRRPKRSLSFGHGAHKCIGEHLGLLEGRVLIEEILNLAPNYEVDPAGVARTYGEFLHGHHKMPIEFKAP